MSKKSTSGPSVRERARTRRLELERARAAQSAAVEAAQIGYFTVADKIDSAHAKVAAARAALDALIDQVATEVAGHESKQRDLIGTLVDEHDQSMEDVAILLDLNVTQVRAARTAYRTARKASTPVTLSPLPADDDDRDAVA